MGKEKKLNSTQLLAYVLLILAILLFVICMVEIPIVIMSKVKNNIVYIEEQKTRFSYNQINESIESTEEEISVEVNAISGQEVIRNGENVSEGQGIRYYVRLRNNTEEDITNIRLEATNTNAIYYGMIEYIYEFQGVIPITHIKYDKGEEVEPPIFEIPELKAGEEVEVNYQIAVKEVNEENLTLKGTINLTANNIEEINIETMENPIVNGKLAISLVTTLPEKVYTQYGIEDITFGAEEDLPIEMTVRNISENIANDVIVKLPIPNEYIIEEEEIFLEEGMELIEIDEDMVSFKIESIAQGEEKKIYMQITAKEMPLEEQECTSKIYFMAEYEEKVYISNDIQKTIIQTKSKITGVQTTNIDKDMVEDGDNIKFYIDIKNEGGAESIIFISDTIQKGLEINYIKIIKNEEETEGDASSRLFSKGVVLGKEESIKIEIDTTLNAEEVIGDKVINEVGVSGIGVETEINNIELTIKRAAIPEEPEEQNDPIEPTAPDLPAIPINPDGPEIPNSPDEPETPSSPTGPSNSNDSEDPSNSNEPDNKNDKNKNLDLKLEKYINKVTVQNAAGTKVYEFNKTQLAKIEIKAKNIANSTVSIEYIIDIINEGEIAGYANEIIDYLPKDLTFNSEINKLWYKGTDGYLRTQELANQKIEPGETKSITLVLQKQMSSNNTGTVVNTAEISKQSGIDKDSTPMNKKTGEDDISNAEIIIAVSTGRVIIYATLILLAVSIIAIGIYVIKIKVID